MTLHDNKPSLISRADRARAAADWAEAARLYRAALDRNPSNPSIWVQYGHALKEAGDLRQSEAAYRTALLHDPASADGYLQLGHALKLQGRGGEAGAAYFRAFAIERFLPNSSPFRPYTASTTCC